MAKKAKVWVGTEWVDLAAATTDLSQYPNMTTTPISGFRNYIINGGMDIAQRGTSLTRGNSDTYGLDRWYVSGFGSGQTFNISQSTTTPPPNFRYFQRVTTTTTSGTNIFISQSLETSNVIPLQNKVVTLSFRYRVPVNLTNQWTARVLWSTGVDANLTPPSSRTEVISSALTNTTSWTTRSLTFTVPATATALTIEFATTGNTVNGAQFDFTGVQLEEGSVATPFERRPIGTELALCQRYYWRGGNLGTVHDCTFYYINANNAGGCVSFPVPMRITPVVTVFNLTTASQVSNVGGGTGTYGSTSTLSTTSFGAMSGSGFGTLGVQFNLAASAEL